MIRHLLLSTLALLLAPLAAWLWPLPQKRIGAIAAVWTLGVLVFFLFMVGPGLLIILIAGFLVPFWGWWRSGHQT